MKSVDEILHYMLRNAMSEESKSYRSDLITQAKTELKELVEGMKREIGEMRYGGCNPDEDRGYNQALFDVIALIDGR